MDNQHENFRKALRNSLAVVKPRPLDTGGMSMACIALILRSAPALTPDSVAGPLELGLIQRVTRTGDPWSGQIALPGGKAEESDVSDVATVLREVREEIGFDLAGEDLMGRLSDQQARSRLRPVPLFLRPFVFFLEKPQNLVLQKEEIEDFFWMPLADLIHPLRRVSHHVQAAGLDVDLPAVDVGRGVPLWGLTYKVLTEFVAILTDLQRRNPQALASINLEEAHLRGWKS